MIQVFRNKSLMKREKVAFVLRMWTKGGDSPLQNHEEDHALFSNSQNLGHMVRVLNYMRVPLKY